MKRSNRLMYLAFLCLEIGWKKTFKQVQPANETAFILTSPDPDRLEHFAKKARKLFDLANAARQEEKFWGEAA